MLFVPILQSNEFERKKLVVEHGEPTSSLQEKEISFSHK